MRREVLYLTNIQQFSGIFINSAVNIIAEKVGTWLNFNRVTGVDPGRVQPPGLRPGPQLVFLLNTLTGNILSIHWGCASDTFVKIIILGTLI